jgi:disulfide bond formation protein DsbB
MMKKSSMLKILLQQRSTAAASLTIAIISTATLAGAWFFQLMVGLAPCPLCLEQRIPYYVAVPLALMIGALAFNAQNKKITRWGLLLLALVLAVGAGLGVYHAGVEWGFWPGPSDCTGMPSFAPGGNILNQMSSTRVVRCDEAAWRFLGISLAGYNALIAGALALYALWAASKKPAA